MNGFEGYRLKILRSRLSAAIILMAIPFYMSFSFLDWLYAREHWLNFLFVRSVSSALFIMIALFMTKSKNLAPKLIVGICHLVTLTLGAGIGYMTYCTGGLNSHYYAGLNWITIGSLAFWPGSSKDRLVTICTIYGPLLLLEVATRIHPFDTASMLALTFMAGTCLLSFINNFLSINSLKEEFQLRGELENLIRDKDKIIEIKSTESANLKRLAKQFSPAVIEAIESRAISLDQRNRKKVAIIFIDVAGSTNRSNHLDHGDYQKALDLFFDLVIKKLLARNITVANFMGDGLMAIANAPYPLPDYERIAFETGVEIIRETQLKQRTLREFWREEFHVRIGISSGFANVGFFPNSDFGVYTAIGETVNLASRLCSAAESSSLATTKNILRTAEESLVNCTLKKGGSISVFKGFSGHDLEFFIAKPKLELQIEAPDGTCPLCNHHLEKGADLGDCIILKCSSCQYSDIQPKVLSAVAASPGTSAPETDQSPQTRPQTRIAS